MRPGPTSLPPSALRPRRSNFLRLGTLIHLGILGVVLLGSWFMYSLQGMPALANFLIGSIVGVAFAAVSFRSLLVPFLMLMFAVGGFRFLFAVQAPILPDLTLERILLVWLTAVFMVKAASQGLRLRRPFTIELLLLAHALYLLVRLFINDMEHFHVYTMSIMVPYASFVFAKNIVNDQRSLRILFGSLLLLNVYYYVTSIAENYSINWLIWPRFILEKTWFIGRSSGPFKNSGIFGNVMGMILPLHLYFLVTTRSRLVKTVLYVSLVFSAVGLFFSYTRGSWLAGFTCLAVIAYFGRRHYLRLMTPALALIPLAVLAVVSFGDTQFFQERVSNEDNVDGRVGTAVTALRVWRDNPLFGCGPYQYINIKENYVAPVNVPGLGTIRFQQFRHGAIHDMYWGPLAEDGLVGTALQFAIYFVIFRRFLARSRYAARGDPFVLYFLPFFGGIFASYLVGGLTISYRHVSVLGSMFYVAAGIMDSYDPRRPMEQDPASPDYGKW